MSATAALVLFVAGGFMGQVAASVVTELVGPWVKHRVMHVQLRHQLKTFGAAHSCPICGRFIGRFHR